MLFYGQYVADVIRRFEENGQLMAEILVNSEHLFVPYTELTEEPTVTPRVIVSQVPANVDISETEVKSIENELNAALPEGVRTQINATEQAVEIKADKVEINGEVYPRNILAEHVTNPKRNAELGEFNSKEFKEFVSKNKLDTKAINDVLEGRQKTHKGFKFYFS